MMRYFYLLLFLCCGGMLQAQFFGSKLKGEVEIAPELNYSFFKGGDIRSKDGPTGAVGFGGHLNAYLVYPLNDKLSLKAGLAYRNRRYRYNADNIRYPISFFQEAQIRDILVKVKLQYISLPIEVRIPLDKYSDIEFGFSLDYVFSVITNSEFKSSQGILLVPRDINKHEFGALSLNVGYRTMIHPKLYFVPRINVGLSSFDVPVLAKMGQPQVNLSLGFSFK